MVKHALALAALLALSACGIDGPPTPPPAETGDAAAPEPRERQGTEVTVGVSGSIGGVVRR